MTPDICIFHGPSCADGFAAAWVVWQRWPNALFYSAKYGDAPPDNLEGKHVVIVDFSYPRDVLRDMVAVGGARSITVVDHHDTAETELKEFAVGQLIDDSVLRERHTPIQALFDKSRSGAVMAWEYAWGTGSPAPQMLYHVQDRDLWRFNMEGTRELGALMMSYPQDFEQFGKLVMQVENPGLKVGLIAQGAAILRDRDRLLADIIAATGRRMVIGGHDVPVANAPYMFASDAGDLLGRGEAFAATYFDREDGKRQFSLRRREGHLRVNDIAKQYGGGGHEAAAGFTVPLGWEGESADTGSVDSITLNAKADPVKVISQDVVDSKEEDQ